MHDMVASKKIGELQWKLFQAKGQPILADRDGRGAHEACRLHVEVVRVDIGAPGVDKGDSLAHVCRQQLP